MKRYFKVKSNKKFSANRYINDKIYISYNGEVPKADNKSDFLYPITSSIFEKWFDEIFINDYFKVF